MEQKYNKTRILIVAMLVVFISMFHYVTKFDVLYFHTFFLLIYFLPLILAGFWFGLKGGLATSIGISILYIPEIILEWQGLSPDDFDRMLEVVLFNIIAPGIGYLRDRERSQESARWEAERLAREQAESANRLKSDFLSIMSDELRTPLISIIGYNDLLLDGLAGSLNQEQINALRRIDNNSKRLLELINSILEFSRLEARSADLKEVSVSDLIKEVESETQSLREKSALNFVWRVEPELPLLHTDPAKLKIVLRNLISNAIKFTEEGSVTVDGHSHNGGVEFGVIDTGIGIAPEDLPIIFEPFRQAESPLTRRHGGVGMGLYTAKRLIEFLGGSIEVESEVGRGSTFRIRIPVRR